MSGVRIKGSDRDPGGAVRVKTRAHKGRGRRRCLTTLGPEEREEKYLNPYCPRGRVVRGRRRGREGVGRLLSPVKGVTDDGSGREFFRSPKFSQSRDKNHLTLKRTHRSNNVEGVLVYTQIQPSPRRTPESDVYDQWSALETR